MQTKNLPLISGRFSVVANGLGAGMTEIIRTEEWCLEERVFVPPACASWKQSHTTTRFDSVKLTPQPVSGYLVHALRIHHLMSLMMNPVERRRNTLETSPEFLTNSRNFCRHSTQLRVECLRGTNYFVYLFRSASNISGVALPCDAGVTSALLGGAVTDAGLSTRPQPLPTDGLAIPLAIPVAPIHSSAISRSNLAAAAFSSGVIPFTGNFTTRNSCGDADDPLAHERASSSGFTSRHRLSPSEVYRFRY